MDRQIFVEVIKPFLIDETLPMINWLMENKLLPREKFCDGCEKKMNWNKYSKGKDGYVWKCYTSGCSEYKKTVSIRHNTVFYNSKLSLQDFIQVIYYWCSDFSEGQAANVLNISTRTIQELYGAFRMACKAFFEENPIYHLGENRLTLNKC